MHDTELVPISRFPELKPGWESGPDTVMRNDRFGRITQMVVVSEGRPIYDVPVFTEPAGAAVLPIDASGRIGLLQVHRPCVLKRDVVQRFPDLNPPGDFGSDLWEAPRGFGTGDETAEETALRECTEETGLSVDSLIRLGRMNANSTFFGMRVTLFAARVRAPVGDSPVQTGEGIRKLQFNSMAEVAQLISDGDLICAFTHSLLLHAALAGLVSFPQKET